MTTTTESEGSARSCFKPSKPHWSIRQSDLIAVSLAAIGGLVANIALQQSWWESPQLQKLGSPVADQALPQVSVEQELPKALPAANSIPSDQITPWAISDVIAVSRTSSHSPPIPWQNESPAVHGLFDDPVTPPPPPRMVSSMTGEVLEPSQAEILSKSEDSPVSSDLAEPPLLIDGGGALRTDAVNRIHALPQTSERVSSSEAEVRYRLPGSMDQELRITIHSTIVQSDGSETPLRGNESSSYSLAGQQTFWAPNESRVEIGSMPGYSTPMAPSRLLTLENEQALHAAPQSIISPQDEYPEAPSVDSVPGKWPRLPGWIKLPFPRRSTDSKSISSAGTAALDERGDHRVSGASETRPETPQKPLSYSTDPPVESRPAGLWSGKLKLLSSPKSR